MYHVVNKINCVVEDFEFCKPYYIGQTKKSINRKMTEHHQNGVLKDRMRNILTRPELGKNVSCIMKFDNIEKQKIYEALIILKKRNQ